MLLKEGPKIFPKKKFSSIRRLFCSLYSSGDLETALREILQDWAEKPIQEIPVPTVITSVDQISGSIQYIASFPMFDQPPLTILQAVMATAAAPTYFSSRHHGKLNLIDGGLGSNSPEAVAIHVLSSYSIKLEDIFMIGVGTAGGQKEKGNIPSASAGGVTWLHKHELLDLMFTAQESVSRKLAQALLGDHYLLVDETPQKKIQLDDTSARTTKLLNDLSESAINKVKKNTVWKRWGQFSN